MSTHPSFSIEEASKLVGKAVEVRLKDGVRIAALSEFIFHSEAKLNHSYRFAHLLPRVQAVSGVLYSIDPEVGHVLLLRNIGPESPKWHPTVYISSSVGAVAELQGYDGLIPEGLHESTDIGQLLGVPREQLSQKELTAKKNSIRAFFDRYSVQIEDQPNDVLLAAGCVKMYPPYHESDCGSLDKTQLERVRGILRRREGGR